MTSTVTGAGLGSSNKLTTKELAIIANGPAIFAAGTVLLSDGSDSPPASPETFETAVNLLFTLPDASSYVIMLTPEGGGSPYIADILDDDDGNMTGFTVASDYETIVHYLVVKKGARNPAL